jgi:hypothetical protein
MKKILSVNPNEKQRILEMHGFANNLNVINEQYNELKSKIVDKFVIGLEKNDVKAFDELSTIIGRKSNEALDVAFNRVLDLAVNGGRVEGAKVMQFCRKLSSFNDQFAQKFYENQIEIIDKIKQKYPNDWEKLVKTNYGEKVLEKVKKGASSSSSSSKLDELGIATQIQNYLNPNRFDGLTKQAFDSQVVLTKNKLSNSSGIFTNQSLLNDVFGIIFSKKATATQIQEVLDIMSMKIGFNKEEKEVFDKLLNYFTTGKNPSFGKYETPWLNDLANMGSSAWNGARPIVEPIANKLINKGIKTLKVAGITVGVVVFLIVVLLCAAISSLRGGGGKKERKYNSKYND